MSTEDPVSNAELTEWGRALLDDVCRRIAVGSDPDLKMSVIRQFPERLPRARRRFDALRRIGIPHDQAMLSAGEILLGRDTASSHQVTGPRVHVSSYLGAIALQDCLESEHKKIRERRDGTGATPVESEPPEPPPPPSGADSD